MRPAPNMLRAWLTLVALSVKRQARFRQMVGIALGLLVMVTLFVGVNSYFDRWNFGRLRVRPYRESLNTHLVRLTQQQAMVGRVPGASALHWGIIGSVGAALENSGFLMFSRWIVFATFQAFLLPIWTLSFATDAIGQEREQRTLIWLFTRPLPRWSIYLAKWLAALPWCLGLNVGGFALICYAGGEPGRLAFHTYWPAVFAGTFAFSALFHLMAATFRRPAIVALLYSFFFETLVGDLPGDLKRLSISFYIRSLMYAATQGMNISPDALTVYSPVRPPIAWAVLLGSTVVFTLVGMWVFSRQEYEDDL